MNQTEGDPGQPGQAGQEGSPPGGKGGRGGRGGVGRQGRRGIPGRTSFLPAIGYAILVAGIIFAFVRQSDISNRQAKASRDNRTFITCVSLWANATDSRTSILTPANLDRQDKLDVVIRDFRLARSTNPKVQAKLRVKFFRDIKTYIKASDKYVNKVKNNPLPIPPKFACDHVEHS